MRTPKFKLDTVSVRFIEGDLEALKQLDPTIPPSAQVRQLIHRYVRKELAALGMPAAAPSPVAAAAEDAAL